MILFVSRFNKFSLLYLPIYTIYYPFKYIVFKPIKSLIWSNKKNNELPCVVTIKNDSDFIEWDVISL